MRKPYVFSSALLFVVLAGALVYIFISYPIISKEENVIKEKESEELLTDIGRYEYFLNMLQDPKTGRIPSGIRRREIEFANNLARLNKLSGKNSPQDFTWQEAGPTEVGGRTRALAVDVANSSVIIAGGISGGIWKSADNGNNWSLKNTTSQVLSVTSVAQDPRPGFTNNWYYTTGEYTNNSAADQGHTAIFTGDGVYKSTDNGETWNILPSTISQDPSSWESSFDYASKVIVNPATGSVFIAANGNGIFRSTNGGESFSIVLGSNGEHVYSDIDISKNGTLLAVISSPATGANSKQSPGIYRSFDDGATWTNITPQGFPSESRRSTVAIAPSNQNTAYILTNTGETVQGNFGMREVNYFFKLNLANAAAENRSANLPDFNFNYEDYVHTYFSYAMVVAVKPDDENLVLIGSSSLFRSFDGFATKPIDSRLCWIGGYHNTAPWFYPNLHPDVHVMSFDPKDPKKMWCGTDGGVSYCPDISDQSYLTFIPWEKKNHGYNVTQFYMVAMPDIANDSRIMGGTQDNGTPFFSWSNTGPSSSTSVGGGDGGCAYFGRDFAYVSLQNGQIDRKRYDQEGKPSDLAGISRIDPSGATNRLFITPFAVDPADENIMFFPSGNELWRNDQLGSLAENLNQGFSGWTKLTGLTARVGYTITALTFSVNPQHVLYYAASSLLGKPYLYRLENANTAVAGSQVVEINGAPDRTYVHNIAVNPDNADEILVVLSNYNIMGLYYSQDGGKTLLPAAGNLQGNAQNPGPSLRAATILPTANGNIYLLATSIGVFSTTQINGANTQWTQQSPAQLGNVVVNHITSRKSDGTVLAGTHGRGAFVAKYSSGTAGTAVLALKANQIEINVAPEQTAAVPLVIENKGNADLKYSITPSMNTRSDKALIKSSSVKAQDSLYNDDGNNLPDNFFGSSNDFYWMNVFNPDQDFNFENVWFYMRTENAAGNSVYFSIAEIVNGQLGTPIFENNLTAPVSKEGTWFDYKLPQPVKLGAGKEYAVTIGSIGTVPYPAAFDQNGSRPGKAYYWNPESNQWVSLKNANIPNGAWLIRLYGTKGGNIQPPLSADPLAGVIAPGTSATINVSFNAQGINEGTYNGKLNIASNGGNAVVNVTVIVTTKVVNTEKEQFIPAEYKIGQNFPNPFNPSTTINFEVPESGEVEIRIFDNIGREVTTLIRKTYTAGRHSVRWDGTNSSGSRVPSGVYIYCMHAKNFDAVRKMVMLK
ncbi:MAG: FlgD immunoglobulin-like domain containing protein [Bacillota bacterium]